ncbi:hypothetical protein GM921_15140 [Pedobacter sp. LMG 31464]|uniref:Uncharacterized protein n=1 Tax=Pedobacter planticolens TaxID=2679964 RepID=A0A923DZB5_9SPHI|nr:hypothetical protein [Pedobacter planticolens]MBB2146837.1 hypothetical protein [Pedobacter planticolens]
MKETGNLPDNQILQQLLKTNVEMIEKINAVSRELVHFKEISRLITEIHKPHFPKDELERDNNLRNKFLAEIIMGIPRKRKKT